MSHGWLGIGHRELPPLGFPFHLGPLSANYTNLQPSLLSQQRFKQAPTLPFQRISWLWVVSSPWRASVVNLLHYTSVCAQEAHMGLETPPAPSPLMFTVPTAVFPLIHSFPPDSKTLPQYHVSSSQVRSDGHFLHWTPTLGRLEFENTWFDYRCWLGRQRQVCGPVSSYPALCQPPFQKVLAA